MLSRDRDAYGQLMLDHLRGAPASEIVERDDGFVSLSPLGSALYFLPPRRWRPLERELLRLRIVGTTMNPYASASPDHSRHHRFNRARGRLAGQLRIRVRHRRFATPWFDYWLASPDELRRAAAGSGWRIARLLRENEPAYAVVMEKERRK